MVNNKIQRILCYRVEKKYVTSDQVKDGVNRL